MKKLIIALFVAIMLLCSISCNNGISKENTQNNTANLITESTETADFEESSEGDYEIQPEEEYADTSCTKEGVDEFMAVLGDIEGASLLSGADFSTENCYNVTPTSVAQETDVKIFKFDGTCLSLAYIDGEIYTLCGYFGGYGFVNAVPLDYNDDGNTDLLVASSWGSGLHRSEISVFDTVTKESKVIHEAPGIDLCVERVIGDSSILYSVSSVDIKVNDNYADLEYECDRVIGYIETENGTPVFVEAQN